MKISYVILGLLTILTSCKDSNKSTFNKSQGDSPYMYVREEAYDAGKVIQGDEVKHTFIVENRGKTDLILKSVVAGCGCTAAEYDKKPILPGKSTPIEVTFNSSGRVGPQNKTVTVTSNAVPDRKTLTLRCEIVLPNKIKKE